MKIGIFRPPLPRRSGLNNRIPKEITIDCPVFLDPPLPRVSRTSFVNGPLKSSLLPSILWKNTLSDKMSTDKIFVGQNYSWDKIFDTYPKFRQFCPTKIFIRRSFVRNLLYRNSSLNRSSNLKQNDGLMQ